MSFTLVFFANRIKRTKYAIRYKENKRRQIKNDLKSSADLFITGGRKKF